MSYKYHIYTHTNICIYSFHKHKLISTNTVQTYGTYVLTSMACASLVADMSSSSSADIVHKVTRHTSEYSLVVLLLQVSEISYLFFTAASFSLLPSYWKPAPIF